MNPEINAECAKRLGLDAVTIECYHCDGTGMCGSELDGFPCDKCGMTGVGPERYTGHDYSGSMDAAMALVQSIKGGFILARSNCQELWMAAFSIECGDFDATAPTPAEAVCLAFLQLPQP